ncbi:MAG: RagB/SusD family nutrient uptake outer membrane protein [Tannerella sp.]|nr:RagB/SusD family nutrient uptake outer membrane protein [Tannerella sp.]
MKNLIFSVFSTLLTLSFTSCDDFLYKVPQAVGSSDLLVGANEIEKMVYAAYSALGNDNYQRGINAMWLYGDLRSGDAYKGGAGTGDMYDWNLIETFVYMRDNVGYLDAKWYEMYINIARVNDALARVNEYEGSDLDKKTRQAELRFLRGHFYFELKTLFNRVPYIDENDKTEDYINISNVEYTGAELWKLIEDEFRYAAENLPETQPEFGRANKLQAKAYLAKTLLYSAYNQNDSHAVTGIDNAKLQEVISLCDQLASKYGLAADFAENFLYEYENGSESVFAIQCSTNDNTFKGRLDFGAMLNYPMGGGYGCCGFHQPSQNMVNAFRTEGGLPLFDTFNDVSLQTPDDLKTYEVDPRINHTVAMPGLPYKYQVDNVFTEGWLRDLGVYGKFMSLKEVVAVDCPCFVKFDPFMSSSKNRDVIRYDDVLLWKAEALIQLDRPDEALPIINSIRERAANSTGRLVDGNNEKTGNFKVETYQPGANCTWTKDYAWKALMFERRLEFSQEGHYFFDLVRWGIADQVVNKYLDVERTRRSYLAEARFTKGRDEYLPIPLNQINFSKKLYQQNPGY